MKSCAAQGQAAGTAAAFAVAHGVVPAAVIASQSAVWSIQQQLLRDDQFILGVYNEDSRDHAQRSTVTASSEQPNGTAAAVLSGQTRALSGARGAAPGQCKNGTNRWISGSGLPQWLQLTFSAPVVVAQVHLVFDTAMYAELSQWCRSAALGSCFPSGGGECKSLGSLPSEVFSAWVGIHSYHKASPGPAI